MFRRLKQIVHLINSIIRQQPQSFVLSEISMTNILLTLKGVQTGHNRSSCYGNLSLTSLTTCVIFYKFMSFHYLERGFVANALLLNIKSFCKLNFIVYMKVSSAFPDRWPDQFGASFVIVTVFVWVQFGGYDDKSIVCHCFCHYKESKYYE